MMANGLCEASHHSVVCADNSEGRWALNLRITLSLKLRFPFISKQALEKNDLIGRSGEEAIKKNNEGKEEIRTRSPLI